MSFTLRKAEFGDAGAIAALSREGLGYRYQEEKVGEKLKKLLNNPEHLILVAEDGGEVLGFVHAVDYDVLYDDTLMNIMGIAVADSARRRGVGRALMRAVEDYAKGRNYLGVRLNSGGSRNGAHAFYENCGYTDRKEQLRFIKYVR